MFRNALYESAGPRIRLSVDPSGLERLLSRRNSPFADDEPTSSHTRLPHLLFLFIFFITLTAFISPVAQHTHSGTPIDEFHIGSLLNRST